MRLYQELHAMLIPSSYAMRSIGLVTISLYTTFLQLRNECLKREEKKRRILVSGALILDRAALKAVGADLVVAVARLASAIGIGARDVSRG
jgi:hypothetical protein